MDKKYNVIMILLDGARYDRIRKMRNFSKLMEKSTIFSQVITYAPYTIASMHAIFSGSYGSRNGVNNYYGTYSFKKNFFLTLTDYLRNNGYYTFGDLLSELVVPAVGFDELKIHNELKDNLTQRHLGFLDEINAIRKDKNFFLYLHYSNIHTKIMLNVLRKYNNFSKEYFEKKEENLKAYDSYVEVADKYLGTILDKIIDSGMIEDTIVVVFSDHGISVGEKFGERAYGAFCYDYTVKTFTLFFQPAIFPKKEIKQLVRTIDTLPTILDFLGINEAQNYEKMDGKTMRPLIQGDKDERYAFIESGNPLKSKMPPKQPNVRAIRTSKWKFIYNYWNDSEELYDLEEDSKENNNLIKEKKEIADDLRKKLNLELRKALSLKIKSLKK